MRQALYFALLCALHLTYSLPSFPYPLCYIPTNPSNGDPLSSCAKESEVTRVMAKENAWRFAPVLFFHPLERYHPEDVDIFLSSASLYDADQVNLGKVTRETLSYVISKDDARTHFFSTKDTEFSRAGAPFDKAGRSTAPVYFSLTETNNTWVYTYYVFYSFNGCSNQQLLLTDDVDGKQRTLDYIACDLGVHEGDWEHITVEVCHDLSSVVRLSYGAHAWNAQLDCTLGECPFKVGTSHPLAYVALNSHAMYHTPSAAHIYYQTYMAVLANVDAISLVDRAIPDPHRYYEPTPENVVELVAPLSAQEDDAGESTRDADVENEQQWLLFPGKWGASYASKPGRLYDPLCLTFNQTDFVDCPNTNLLEIARALLNISTQSVFKNVAGSLYRAALGILRSNGPQGPYFKDSFRSFEPFAPAPVLKASNRNDTDDTGSTDGDGAG
eukprot:Rmarinus@m.10607